MRLIRWTRPAALLSAVALAGVTLAGPGTGTAGAAPVAPFTVEGAVSASGSVASFVYTIEVTGSPITSATLATDQDAALPADDGSLAGLRVDRARTSTATRSNNGTGPDLIVALSNLSVGRHTVSFPVEVPRNGAARTTHSSATLTDDTTSAAADSDDVTLAINSPDLVLSYTDTDDSPSDTVPLGLGRGGEIDYTVTNTGTSSAEAELVLTLPSGMALDGEDPVMAGEDGDPLTCTSTGTDPVTVVCSLGTVSARADTLIVAVNIIGTAAGQPGTTAQYSAALRTAQGTPDDTDLSNNTLGFTVVYTGEARLTTTVSAPASRLTIGQTMRITVTVRNDGPQDAPGALALATVLGEDTDPENPELTIVGFDGETDSGANPFVSHRTPIRAHLPSTLTRHEISFTDLFRFWSIGTLPSGSSITAHFTLKAVHRGTGTFTVASLSDAGDTACPVLDDDADPDATYPCVGVKTVSVVAASTHRPSGHGTPTGTGNTGTNPTGSGTGLANTGSPTLPLTLTALVLLLAGAALTRAGRRRVRA